MELKQIMESRLQAMEAERDRLTEAWKPNIDSVKAYMAKQGKTLTKMDERNIARCLENATIEALGRSRSKLFETTDSSAIQFLGIQLPIISALLPSLVLNKIATVQALDRRSAGVFYMDVKYGNAKGTVAAGDTMIGAKTGQNKTVDGRYYASQRIGAEVISGSGTTFTSAVLTYLPVIAGSVVITGGTSGETFTDNGANVLVSSRSSGATGSIDYTTGVFSVTFQSSQASGAVSADYRYNYQTMTETSTLSPVPEVNVSVSYDTVTALDFILRSKYTLAAAIDLEKAHGLKDLARNHRNMIYN